ncbi:MAG: glycosyltransferase, partial [Planctomycetota bacterium]
RLDLLDEPFKTLLRDGTRKLLFLGRLSTKKGLDRLLPALPRLPEDVRLVVAGPDEGARAGLERTTAALGLEGRVQFVGPVTGLARAALLERAELLLLPSRSENFGNVVLEALAAGTPAVVTPEVGAAEVLRHTGAGRVVAGTPEALAEDLNRVLGDSSLLRDLRRRARGAAEDYTWPRVAERLEHEFERVLDQASDRTAGLPVGAGVRALSEAGTPAN